MDLLEIQEKLKENSNEKVADSTRKFVPGAVKVYGVSMPVLNILAKEYKKGEFELVVALWEQGAYEEKILAVKILGSIAKKDPEHSLQLVRHFAPGIDNWAICDAIGMQALNPIVKTHKESIFELAKQFNKSSDFWERRLSLVLVEWFTRDINVHNEILPLVKNLENDKEYYVKKGVEWIYRNMKKGK
jgi:3-methyladenine DNA glycosylase AlkD